MFYTVLLVTKIIFKFFLIKKKLLENNLISLIDADLSSLKLYVEKMLNKSLLYTLRKQI